MAYLEPRLLRRVDRSDDEGTVAVRGHIPMFFAGDGVWAHLYHNCGGESPLETMGLKITTGTVYCTGHGTCKKFGWVGSSV